MRYLVSVAGLLLLLLASIPAFSVTAQNSSLLDLLPAADDVGTGFVVVDNRARTLGEQGAAFANPDEAARLLAGWQWQDNAFKVFQAAELTPAGAPVATVDISLTRFANAADAAAAMPYFLQDRAAVLGQREAQDLSQRPVGDEMRFVTGDVEGGFDTTLYVRSGPLLMRISATAISGAAVLSLEQIAQGIIDRSAGRTPSVTIMQRAASAPSLSETLPLGHATCFRIAGEGALDLPAIAERLATGSDVSATLDELGWEEGAYRQFACDPPAGSAGWIDMSVHHFPDAGSAADAVSVFAEMRALGMDLQPAPFIDLGDGDAALAGPAVNGSEYTRYVSSGPLLFAVTGVAPVGDPRSDVEQIAAALLALNAPGAAEDMPTSTPDVRDEVAPAVAPISTPTPLPAPVVVPTPPPAPTATLVPLPTPLPTAMVLPTAPPPPPTAAPAETPPLIPIAIPPQPTATAGPLPTATPRVIRLPTPGAD